LVGSPTTVVFAPLDPDPNRTTLTGTDAETRKTGGPYHEAVVTARDIHGNVVPGVPVLFDLTGIGTLRPGFDLEGTTNSAGQYKIEVVSASTTGFAYVTAQFGVPGGSATTAVTGGQSQATRLALEFVADTVEPTESDFALSTGDRLADGVAAHTITVTLRDTNRTLVTGEADHITATPTGGLGTGAVGTWDEVSTGVYEASVTSTVAGIKDITVSWAGEDIGPLTPPGATSIAFVHGPVSGLESEFAVSTGDVVADGAANHYHTVTVILRDAQRNPISDFDPDDLAAVAAVAGTQPQVTANVADFARAAADGAYTARITATTAGDYTVSATANEGSVIVVPVVGNAIAHFVAGPPGGLSSLAVDYTERQVRHNITATVELLDNEGNPVAPTTVTFWTVPELTLPGNGEAVTGQGTGVATLSFTTTRAGNYELHAAYGLPSAELPESPIAIKFTPGPKVFGDGLTELTGSSGTRLANGVEYHTATVTVRDADRNPIADAEVEFTVGGVGSLAAGYPAVGDTSASGQYTVRIVSAAYLAGQSTIQATVDGDVLTDGQTTDAVVLRQDFIDPPIGEGSRYALSTGTRIANGTDAHTLTVTLLSTTGTPLTGQSADLTARAAGRDGQADGLVSSFIENPAGVYTASIRAAVLGTKDVTVTWDGTASVAPVTPPGTTTVVFGPDDYDPDHSGFSVSETPEVRADGAANHYQTVTVILGDAWGNPISGRAADLDASAALIGDPTIEATVGAFAPTATPGQYSAAITSTQAGSFLVTATLDDGGANPVSVPTVGNDIAIFVAGDADPDTSTLEVSLTELLVGETTVATVTARDANGNPRAGTQIHLWTVPALPGGGEWWLTTGDAGSATQDITTTDAGVYTLHAALGSSTDEITGSPVDIDFNPKPVDPDESFFAVSAYPNIVADGAHYQVATVTLLDEYGNEVSPLVGTLTVAAVENGVAATVGTVTAGADPGTYVVSISATAAGSYTVTVNYTAPGETSPAAIGHGVANDQAVFVPGEPDPDESTLSVTPGEVVVGLNHYATVAVEDASGNPVPGAQVQFWTVPALVIAGSGVDTSGADGEAQVALTTDVAGTYVVHASISGEEVTNSGLLSVTFVAGEVDPDTSVLSILTLGNVVVADGVGTHVAQVHFRDGDGNDKSGVVATVTITSPSGQETVRTTSVSDADGIGFIDFTATQAGEWEVAATVRVGGADVAVTGSPQTVTFVPGEPSVNTSTLASSKQYVEADGVDYALLTVTLYDPQGNPLGVGGDQVTLNTTHGQTAPVTDHGDGTYTARGTASSAGDATISFTVGGQTSSGPAPRTQTVIYVDTPAAPVPQYANRTTVVGTAGPGTTIRVYNATGSEICETTTGASGAFRCQGLNPAPAHEAVLSLTASESHGFTSPAATVTVDAEPPDPPVVDPTDGTEVTGSGGEPGDTVIIRDPDDNVVLCETEVDVDGTFRCGPLDPRPGDGTPIEIVVTDPSDNPSEPTVVVVDSSEPEAPAVDPSDGTVVYGDAEPGAQVVVRDGDGAQLCAALARPDGAWNCEPNRDVPGGEQLEVVAVDPAGNVSRQTIVVADKTLPGAPTVNPSNGRTITGTGTPGYTVVVTFPGGAEAVTTVDKDGNWSLTPPSSYTPGHGDELKIHQETQFNRAQVKVSSAERLILDRVAPDRAQPRPTGGGTLSGKGEVAARVVVTGLNGTELAAGTVDAAGNWTVNLPAGVVVGDTVVVKLIDAAQNVSEEFRLRVGLVAVSTDKTVVGLGERVVFTVINLQPAENSSGTVHSTPVSLGGVIADAAGGATYTWTVPVDAELGTHTFHVLGEFSGEAVSAEFTIIAPPVPLVEEPTPTPTPLAKTGASPATAAVLWTGVGALGFGLFLLLIARLRRRRADN
jgi:protocatechuate 3,4-dioxygenase beta subunit